jgi:hypothetical protein
MKSDYAIMKQVQQLKLSHPYPIVTLDDTTNFSGLGAGEKLYIVSHGNPADENLRDIVLPTLVRYLSDQTLGLGVPRAFGGIVILSCYSGQKMGGFSSSLAARLAIKLTGRVAAGTPVTGASGYSFGTPEFRKSGQSSVLALGLGSFYFADNLDSMRRDWLAHKPTHAGGALKDLFKSDVDTAKTIEVNIKESSPAARNMPTRAPTTSHWPRSPRSPSRPKRSKNRSRRLSTGFRETRWPSGPTIC